MEPKACKNRRKSAGGNDRNPLSTLAGDSAALEKIPFTPAEKSAALEKTFVPPPRARQPRKGLFHPCRKPGNPVPPPFYSSRGLGSPGEGIFTVVGISAGSEKPFCVL